MRSEGDNSQTWLLVRQQQPGMPVVCGSIRVPCLNSTLCKGPHIFASPHFTRALLLFPLSVRADPLEAESWLKTSSNTVALALNLVPFPGIAFL
jgi:hypothetical protein